MARNDTILLDGIIDDRVASNLPSNKRDEAFEYFAFQQILRDYDLSHDEIMAGAVDGRDDGGIDGIFLLVNGNLLVDPASFFWPRQNSQLSVVVITCKHHDTFRQAPLDNLVATISELFDLSIDSSDLQGAYSQTLIRVRETLAIAYRRLSPRMDRFTVEFVYASRGDSQKVGDSIVARANQAATKVKELFGNAESDFQFFGAAELVTSHRKTRMRTHDLPFVESLTMNNQYAVLCNLAEYARFISDEHGHLRRYMFDSNIRAFMGLNRVNEDIKDTLASVSTPEFWWLNNGITILADSASVIGKAIQVSEPQIVNGLQTSESIFRHFSGGGSDPQNRCVLVKVLVTSDAVTRDAVIRSTNNQTNIELASLHATDKVQRDIEEYLRRDGLFYERRKNYYVEQGLHPRDVLTPMYLAGGFVSLVLKSPRTAATLKSRFMRDTATYERVFSEKHLIQVWPKIARILRHVDSVLERNRPTGFASGERYLKSWRQLTAFVAVSRILTRYTFSQADLAALDLDLLTADVIHETVELIVAEAGPRLTPKLSRKSQFIVQVCATAATRYGIDGVQVVENKNPFAFPSLLSTGFLERVNAELPSQPWRPGVHRQVAAILQCSPALITAAINQLIEDGARNKQEDGVVYDSAGNVIAVDRTRTELDADLATPDTTKSDEPTYAPE